jgi:hypothetical protein
MQKGILTNNFKLSPSMLASEKGYSIGKI